MRNVKLRCTLALFAVDAKKINQTIPSSIVFTMAKYMVLLE